MPAFHRRSSRVINTPIIVNTASPRANRKSCAGPQVSRCGFMRPNQAEKMTPIHGCRRMKGMATAAIANRTRSRIGMTQALAPTGGTRSSAGRERRTASHSSSMIRIQTISP